MMAKQQQQQQTPSSSAPAAEVWCDAVAALLRARGAMTAPELRREVPGLSGRVVPTVKRDARFVVTTQAWTRLPLVALAPAAPPQAAAEAVEEEEVERPSSNKKTKVKPAEASAEAASTAVVCAPPKGRTACKAQPSALIWELVLSATDATWTGDAALSEWRWLSLLPRVCSQFRDLVHPQRTRLMELMASADGAERLCKARASALFGLCLRDLTPIPYREASDAAVWRRGRATHHMHRAPVLQLAQARFGRTFEDLGRAWEERKERIARLRAQHHVPPEEAQRVGVRLQAPYFKQRQFEIEEHELWVAVQ